jgi:hypothetical protein
VSRASVLTTRPLSDYGIRDEGGSILAFDRESARSYNKDGHLYVERTNITKANVCPYIGREIPGWQSLGLDANRVYRLLRDPEELRKALPTFRNLPALREHLYITAKDHVPELVVGSTGSDPAFDGTYLTNSLAVWPEVAIDAIERRERFHVSASYHYRADMTPGVYKGEAYDGVMRDIRGNHVAFVPKGRAGSDVVVCDEALPRPNIITSFEERTMAKRPAVKPQARRPALRPIVAENLLKGYLLPRLATDAELDLRPVVKAFGQPKKLDLEAGKTALLAALNPKEAATLLAQDADIADVQEVLEALKEAAPQVADLVVGGPEAAAAAPASPPVPAEEPAEGAAAPEVPPDVDKDGEVDNSDVMVNQIMQFLDGKLSPEDMAELSQIIEGGQEDPPVAAEDTKLTKAAMDAAIEQRVSQALEADRAKRREAFEAQQFATAWVGPIRIAMDSAPDVYRFVLKKLGVPNVDKLHPDALKPILQAQPIPGRARETARSPVVATDADASRGYQERYGDPLKRLVG